MIDALPDVSELKNMDTDELSEVHDKAQEAYDAFEALTEEQQADLSEELAKLRDVLEYMARLTASAATSGTTDGFSYNFRYDAGHDPNYYNKDSDKIASVTIVWTAMSFSYNKGTWDTDTMTWEGGGWEADVGCGTVTVTNTGNLDVIAQFGVNFTDNTLGISVSFTENGTVLTDNKLTIAKGAEKTVSVKLTGDEPSEYIETAKTIGQITITLSTE